MGAPEGPHDVARISVADPVADLLHCEVGRDEEAMARKIDSNWERFLDLTLATPGFLAE
ncbi:MAG: hypothetical protein H0T55_04850 [Rubrobacteraceae bacterium]|nr:hypothetical protein [Rubrobacteraceae bacterium]MBA3616553.1 hypothetical protein [Rubrobacteraceae bacterium]MDQ3437737.1 hypothetical protein [Actinomycetota bacterium]